MTTPAIELHIVNATALDPNKVYLIEVDRTKVPEATSQALLQGLFKHFGIRGVMVRSIGGNGVRILESTELR